MAGCTPLCAVELHNFQTENGGWEGKEKLCRELMLCWEQPRKCSGGLGARQEGGLVLQADLPARL